MIASYFNGWYVGSGNTRAFRYATTGSEMSRTYGTLSLQPFLSQPLKWLATVVMPPTGLYFATAILFLPFFRRALYILARLLKGKERIAFYFFLHFLRV